MVPTTYYKENFIFSIRKLILTFGGKSIIIDTDKNKIKEKINV